jgi:Ca-activated chloride channel family protein
VLSVKNKLQQGSWQAVCDADLLPFVLQEKLTQQSRAPLFASSLAAVLAILAMAGPTWQRIPTPVFRNAAALVIVLDLSRSMDAAADIYRHFPELLFLKQNYLILLTQYCR